MSNIHNYPLESLTFGDDDYYDIDFFTGSGYETRKIKGSVIKAGITAALGDNIYNADGVLTSTRLVDGATNNLAFLNIRQFFLNTIPQGPGEYGMLLEVDTDLIGPNDFYFKISDVGTGGLGEILTITKNKDFRIFDEYNLPQIDGADGQILKTNGAGVTEFASTQDLANTYNHSSTQWSKTIPSPVTLGGANEVANGFTFFTNADKSAGGTTSYDEYSINYGLSITLTQTIGGTANVSFDGGVTNYLATFNTDLFTTASDFVATHESALNSANIRVFALGSGADGRLRFCAAEATLNAMTITNATGDLSGTIANEFTGDITAQPDHVLVPYVGTAFEGQRLHHTFRVNFGIVSGSTQYYGLSLRRYSNDSIIGSELLVTRQNDVEGTQVNFVSYTNGATDPFVLGGFYFALRNDTGQDVQIFSAIGILIQNSYQKLTQF